MPKDRNLIDQFYSVGFGGNGGLFGRVNDNRGVGWAGTHFSADFRQDAADLGVELSFVNSRMAIRVRAVPSMRTVLPAVYLDLSRAGRLGSRKRPTGTRTPGDQLR